MKPLAQNTLIQNRYLIVHLIGKGGMGEVYLAVDQRLGSAVALKRTFFAGDEMLGNAFEREARTLARMRHPVLPKVSDHFTENDEQYLVMEHISGDDLSKRLEAAGKSFPLSWVLFWADQLLDALSYLHTHEPPIIHRDIKPQNLKLTDENHIILLDFGLSKTSTGQTNISQSGSTGSVVGYTPHYAPMEQIRGIGTSARSDLYSLSATLYQLLTNSIPVDALSRADSMLNGMPDPIRPPHELNPEVPNVVSEVILRGMEVSQEKRYANAREMQRVLRKAFNDIQQATTANTVAFSAAEAEAIRAEPDPVLDADEQAAVSSKPAFVSEEGDSEAEAPAIAPDSTIDLDATMAYGTPFPDNDAKQSDVKTEVFLAGSSGPVAPPEPAIDQISFNSEPIEAGSFEPEHDTSNNGPITSEVQGGAYTADATVPFIALDHTAVAPPGDVSPSDPDFFEPESTASAAAEPVFEPEAYIEAEQRASVPEASAHAVAAVSPARPASKSSGKMIVVIGALAAVLLLGVAVAGGIWAYMNYGPGAAVEPTPEPSPEETVVPTPSPTPEPSVESGVNAGNGNSNSALSNSNTNSNNDIVVEPTPEERPADNSDSPPVTARTPRPATTPRGGQPPAVRSTPPPRKPPVPRATVLP